MAPASFHCGKPSRESLICSGTLANACFPMAPNTRRPACRTRSFGAILIDSHATARTAMTISAYELILSSKTKILLIAAAVGVSSKLTEVIRGRGHPLVLFGSDMAEISTLTDADIGQTRGSAPTRVGAGGLPPPAGRKPPQSVAGPPVSSWQSN